MSEENQEKQSELEEQEAQPLRIDEAAEVLDVRQATKTGDPEDDDETWTNQPIKGAKDEELSETAIGDDLDEDEENVETPRAPRKVIKNGRDVLCEELPDRAERARLRLKPYVSGMLVFELTNSGERFLFDWRDELPKVSSITKETSVTCDEALGLVVSNERLNVDAIISVSEKNLMSIRSGDLNPQVGMLTDKIKIRGKVSPCVYVFNLVAPRVRG